MLVMVVVLVANASTVGVSIQEHTVLANAAGLAWRVEKAAEAVSVTVVFAGLRLSLRFCLLELPDVTVSVVVVVEVK